MRTHDDHESSSWGRLPATRVTLFGWPISTPLLASLFLLLFLLFRLYVRWEVRAKKRERPDIKSNRRNEDFLPASPPVRSC